MSNAAQILLAVAALVGAFSLLLLVWRRGFQSLAVKVAGMSATLEGVDRTTKSIDAAVNHQPSDHPPIAEQVREIWAHHEWTVAAIEAIAGPLGVILPPHPSDPGAT